MNPTYKTILIIFIGIILSNNSHSQQGLKAEYYDGTNFNRLVAVNYVSNIDQSWYDSPPVPDMNPHECSIRYTGKLKTAKSGKYTFAAQVDDGIRVWIDDYLIIDQWELNDMGQFKGTIDLTAQQEYDLKVEYFNGLVEGEVRLLWTMHKEELSLYEKLFGEDLQFKVITPEHFVRPDEPIKPKEKEKTKPKKAITKTTTKKKPAPTPQKKIEVVQTEQKTTTPKPKTPKFVVSDEVIEKYIPKNVQFEKGKTIILETSYAELNTFIEFMLKYPHLKVKVEGHTDVVGDPDLNLQLSKDRAKTITDYLVEKGINGRRIQSQGFGSSRPLFIPQEGKPHPANRRVVFIIDGQ